MTTGDVGRVDGVTRGIRRISVRQYLAIVAGYLLVLLIGTIVARVVLDGDGVPSGTGTGVATYAEVGDVWRRLVLPVGCSAVFVLAVVSALGWWRPVLEERRTVQRWVWVVPGLMALTILAGTNYGGLAATSVQLVASLLLGAMLVGLAEEIVFRGLGVTAFRLNGYRERRVALWTSVLFGVSHSVALLAGPAGLIQVAYTLVGGYLYYLTRRVSGGLLLPVLLHGAWDFGVLSAGVVEDETYGAVPLFFLPHLVLLLVLLIRRRHIEPEPVAG